MDEFITKDSMTSDVITNKYRFPADFTEKATNIRPGYTMKIDGRKYTLIKVYPFMFKFEGKNGDIKYLSIGDIVSTRAESVIKKFLGK